MRLFTPIFGGLSRWLALLALSSLLVCGCTDTKPADSQSVKYANPQNAGAKLDVKSVLIPGQMNLVYFYADW